MNKQDIISRLCAAEPGSSRTDHRNVVDMITSLIMDFVGRGHRVTIAGFGTFETRKMKPRKARNPRTGTAVDVAACVKPVFRPSPKFKKMVEDGDAEKKE